MTHTATCEFCGKAFQWTQEQVKLDGLLRLAASCDGLGASCSECDDKQIALFLAQDAADGEDCEA